MFLDVLFPSRCLNCNRIIAAEDIICQACKPLVPFSTYGFTEENPLLSHCRLLFPTEHAFALMNFEKGSLSQTIIHSLKYSSNERAGKVLADWAAERIDFKDSRPDLLAAIPLHPKKLKKRGYNQLHLFAETFSEHTGIPFEREILKRNFHGAAQAHKDRNRREVRELFSLTRAVSAKHVLIIDDVLTTGNTMSAAAWEFLKNGVAVSVLILAND